MNILVCIKQVPDTTEIKIDPVKNTLIRDGVPAIVNPFDAYALEAAARMKDKDPSAQIVVMSMGPAGAREALKECLAIAADKAYLVSGRAFGGSDTLATSYILANAMKKIEELEGHFDLIFCGKQAIDGDTAQVGPEIGEHLNYPQVTCALEVLDFDAEHLEVLKEGQDANMVIGVQLPCVVTFTKPGFDPRFPSIKRRLAANRADIPVLDEAALESMIDSGCIGLKGSPTKVKKSFVPQKKSGGIRVAEESPEASVAKLVELLNGAQVI